MSHEERKHSKFSASGAERWFECAGSVELSDGIPDKSSPYAEEGTRAHEVLEALLLGGISNMGGRPYIRFNDGSLPTEQMWEHGTNLRDFILRLWKKCPDSEILVETKVNLDFIHPDFGGTFDGAVVDYFETLNVFDYKYGAGVAVSPLNNLQMISYGMGVAHRYNWNFKNVRLWIDQPRIKGYDGPAYWELPLMGLWDYVEIFTERVEYVRNHPDEFVEGPHCHWCKAKPVCPLKTEGRIKKARSVFTAAPLKE